MGYALAKLLRIQVEKSIHVHEPAAVLKNAAFPWAQKVESYFPSIKKEATEVIKNLESITNFDDILPNQKALYQKEAWKSYFLVALGEDVPAHQKNCPETTKALKEIPELINGFYSILKPGVHIPPHRGPYAGIVRYHLGLIIPEGDVAIKVNGQTCHWKEGESLFFDDSFEHEAWNNTNSLRVILFVDFERPLPPVLSAFNKMILKIFKMSKTVRKAQDKILANQ